MTAPGEEGDEAFVEEEEEEEAAAALEAARIGGDAPRDVTDQPEERQSEEYGVPDEEIPPDE
jgi:hypothetical protein